MRLEAVYLKAMALQQSDRYQTTDELAADLEAWLADQPVSAVNEPLLARLRRWIRHHETAVGTVTATVVVTSMALLILVAVVAVTNGRLLEANTRALASERDARHNAERAERHAREADEQKNLAKHNAEESRIQADRAETEAARAVAESRRSEQTTRFVARLFQASNPTGFLGFGVGRRPEDDNTLTAAEVLARGRKRLATELSTAPLLRASLRDTLGDVYRGRGQYDDAEVLLSQALAIRRQEPNVSPLELAASLHHIGVLKREVAYYQDAQRLLTESLALRRENLPENDDLIIDTMFDLAWALAELQQHAASEAMFRDVIDLRSKKPGGNRHMVKFAQAGLVTVLLAQNKDTEAMLQSLNQDVLGLEAVVAFVAYQTAMKTRKAGQFEASEQAYQTVLEVARRKLNEEHPVIALILGDMAGMLREKGEYTRAEKFFREAVKIGRSSLGEHPKMIEPLVIFAREMRAQGRFDESEQSFQQALDIAVRRSPDKKRKQQQLLLDLAGLARTRGLYQKSLDLLVRAAEANKPLDDPPVELEIQLAQLQDLGALQRRDEVIRIADTCLKGIRSNQDLVRQAVNLGTVADVFRNVGELEQAAALDRDALALVHQSRPGFVANQQAAPLAFVYLLSSAGEREEAAALATHGLKIIQSSHRPEHPTLGFAQRDAGWAAAKAGDLDRAESLLRASVATHKRQFATDHVWVLEDRSRLVCVLFLRNPGGEGLDAASQVRDDAVAVLDSDHPWLWPIRRRFAAMLSQRGKYDEAITEARENIRSMREILPRGQVQLFNAETDLIHDLIQAGQTDDAGKLSTTLSTQSEEKHADESWQRAVLQSVQARLLAARDNAQAAEPMAAAAYERLLNTFGIQDARSQRALNTLIEVCRALKQVEREMELSKLVDPGALLLR